MKINKAVITAAGFGTRFLPVTKTIQKEMLPILNRPIIDYVVEDCIEAGITEIIFVIKPTDTQVKHFYSESKHLESYLARMGKSEKYEMVKDLHSKAKFSFVEQLDSDPYGTAVPVLKAAPLLAGEEAFVVLMGDDFLLDKSGSSLTKGMIDLFSNDDLGAVTTFITKPNELLHKYGIAEVDVQGDRIYLKSIVEKPEPGSAPSNLVNISKYVFGAEVLEIIKNQKINPKRGELEITDSVMELSKTRKIGVYKPQGDYLDGGYPLGLLRANLMVAAANESMHEELQDIINELKNHGF